MEINKENVILKTILELKPEFEKMDGYLTKEEIIQRKNKKGFFSNLKNIWKNIKEIPDDDILFGFDDSLIFTKNEIVFLNKNNMVLQGNPWGGKLLSNPYEISNEIKKSNNSDNRNTKLSLEAPSYYSNFFFEEDTIYKSKGEGFYKFSLYLNVREFQNVVNYNRYGIQLSNSIFKALSFLGNRLDTIENKIKDEKVAEEHKVISSKKNELIKALDKDNNGTIDIIEGQDDLMLLLKKHQNKIIEKQKEDSTPYPQHFIKVSNYIKDKKQNLQTLFTEVLKIDKEEKLEVYTGILHNEIHLFNLLLFNSLNMVAAIANDDLFTFYDIYEKLDKLGIFNSHWENEVTNRLEKLEEGLDNLMIEINKVGSQIISSINQLSYLTQETNNILESELKSINSSIQSGNLLSAIQTYQLYKINTQTKGLIK